MPEGDVRNPQKKTLVPNTTFQNGFFKTPTGHILDAYRQRVREQLASRLSAKPSNDAGVFSGFFSGLTQFLTPVHFGYSHTTTPMFAHAMSHSGGSSHSLNSGAGTPGGSESDNNKSNTQLSAAQDMAASLMTGAFAGFASYPFEAFKKKKQSDQKVKGLTVRELFRGGPAFASSVGPTTLVQYSVNGALLKFVFSEEPSQKEKIAAGLLSGGSGAVVSTFVENTILVQQLHSLGPFGAIRHMFRQSPTRPWTGCTMLGAREMTFGSCYLIFSGMAGDYAAEHVGEWARMPAKLGVGIGGALLSHAPDTIATMSQKEAEQHYKATGQSLKPNPLTVARNAIRDEGVKSLYKGGGHRVLLFTTVMLVNEYGKPVADAGMEWISKQWGRLMHP